MALLHDLVRKHGGRRGAAGVLGIDRRTVAACMDGRGMSWRMREALERGLQEGAGSAAARQRKRSDALDRRVDALEIEFLSGLEDARKAMNEDLQALREEQVREPKPMGRGPAQPVTPRGARAVSKVAQETGKPAAASVPKRLYPELVTKEPASDDEEVYGDAWPLIHEWREIWKAGHRGTGKGLEWLRIEERVRALEVAMLEQHGLTLPPETMPLTGVWRSDQLNWRKETLHDVRKALAWVELRLWVRRVLTFNLRRN